MIDAGLKLEGEMVGEVSEGIGSAIGGPGVDAYKIEEKITKYKIRNYAVIVKEDIGDAVSPMRKEINDAVDKVIERVRDVVKERTKEGDTVLNRRCRQQHRSWTINEVTQNDSTTNQNIRKQQNQHIPNIS